MDGGVNESFSLSSVTACETERVCVEMSESSYEKLENFGARN